MERIGNDFRLAVRALGRRPGFALTIVLTLGVAIGGSAAVFGIVDAILLRPLPYRQPERLVAIWETRPETPLRPVAPANFLDWRRQSVSFAGLSSWLVNDASVRFDDRLERIEVAAVSADFLNTLGASLILGRAHLPEDGDRSPAPVVISERLWRTRLGADPSSLGDTLEIDGVDHPIVGVANRDVAYPPGAELWMTVPHDVAPAGPADIDLTTWRDAWYLGVIGRLADGVAIEQGAAEMDAIAERLRQQYPETNRDGGVTVRALAGVIVRGTRPTLSTIGAIAALLLGLALANVVNLAVARLAERRREIVVRRALGARPVQLLRQLVVEGLAIAGAAGAVSVPVAVLVQRSLLAWLPPETPRLHEVGLDWRVFATALGLALLAGVVLGAVPLAVTRIARGDATAILRGGPGAATIGDVRRVAHVLVAAQLALAVALVAAASLMAATLLELGRVHPGYRPDGLVSLRIDLPAGGEAASNAVDLTAMVSRLDSLPGSRAAGGLVSLNRGGPGAGLDIDGVAREGNPPNIQWTMVTPGYFELLEIPVHAGRTLSNQDDVTGAPVAVINATAARQHFADGEAIGRRIRTGLDGRDGVWVTIVGVVGDVHDDGLETPPQPRMYRPLSQTTRWNPEGLQLLVRAPGGAESIAAAARAAVTAVRTDVPVTRVQPLGDILQSEQAPRRLAGVLAAVFSVLALVLAAIGVHGVMAAMVTSRRTELAVRLSLGATPGRLGRDVLTRSLWLALQGLGAGGLLALAVERMLQGMVWGASLADGWLLIVNLGVLVIAALLGAALPARAAARTEIVLAMRGL